MQEYENFQSPEGYKYVRNVIRVSYMYSAFEATYHEKFYFEGEMHHHWELVYVISGGAAVSGDDRVYYLSSGDIIFHKPLEFHRVWAVGNMKPHLFVVAFQIEGPSCSSFENSVYMLNEVQRKKVNELITYLKANTMFEPYQEVGYVENFLNNWQEPHIPQNVANRLESFLLSVLEDENLTVKKEDLREETKVYKEIVSILVENINGQITLDEIAKQCKLSKSQIKKKFAAISDIGIHKYFLKLKIAESMKLLAEGYAINEISRMLDFSTPNYFSMAFKREVGMSPLAYKNSMIK